MYDKMSDSKWVMAYGSCARGSGAFNIYAVTTGIDELIPVDVYVPGCPPDPEYLIDDGLQLLEAKIRGGGAT